MQSFDSLSHFRNGKKKDTAISIKMRETNSTEGSPIMNTLERNVEDEPQVLVLTQEAVNEQIRNHIAPLTKHLQDLIRLIKAMKTAQHPTSNPSAATSASFSAAGYQLDTSLTLPIQI